MIAVEIGTISVGSPFYALNYLKIPALLSVLLKSGFKGSGLFNGPKTGQLTKKSKFYNPFVTFTPFLRISICSLVLEA